MRMIALVQKEAITLKFTIRDKKTREKITDGSLLTATCALYIKENKEDDFNDAKITKSDSNFDKSFSSTGIVKVSLSSNDLDIYGNYYGLLKIIFSSTNIQKSYFKVEIEQSPE